eukprot:TRINITY_DN25969_c0_g1_i1.p1 TRINITY_DN25969_c0_g1~~TRINITY_DN25969_c0_g1_i1.p1  ORF type:complete len:915 (+),score=196.43 TRINITY_DN25969_c0_g1_i1:62-2746(+)
MDAAQEELLRCCLEGHELLAAGRATAARKKYEAACQAAGDDACPAAVLLNRARCSRRLGLYKHVHRDASAAALRAVQTGDSWSALAAHWLLVEASRKLQDTAVDALTPPLDFALWKLSGCTDALGELLLEGTPTPPAAAAPVAPLKESAPAPPAAVPARQKPASELRPVDAKAASEPDVGEVLQTLLRAQKAQQRDGGPSPAQQGALDRLRAATGSMARSSGEVSTDVLVSYGYAKVNEGKHGEAIEHFTSLLEHCPKLLAALAARGTSRALVGDLQGALCDFDAALQQTDKDSDLFRRRAQVHGALGKHKLAVADLESACRLTPKDPDAWRELSMAFRACGRIRQSVDAARKVTEHSPSAPGSWQLLGHALLAEGDCTGSKEAFVKGSELPGANAELLTGYALACRDWGEGEEAVAGATKALERYGLSGPVLHLRGFVWYQMGEYAKAAADLQKARQLRPDDRDSYYLEALSYHNMGKFAEAVATYGELLKRWPEDCAFFNRELCLLLRSSLYQPWSQLCYDALAHPSLLEAWCKRKKGAAHLPADYVRQQPLRGDGGLPRGRPLEREALAAVESIGSSIQYSSPGFLRNKRAHRACGLAIVETAQRLRDSGWKMDWRDFFSLAVRWRQMADHGDPVHWIDSLPAEAFEDGFGLQTPLLTGEHRVPRYYPYFQRTFEMFRSLITEQYILTDSQLDAISSAKTPEEVWVAIGQDCFAVTPCHRSDPAAPPMEATRLTLIRTSAREGVQLAIRTPGTPSRFVAFGVELQRAFEDFCQAAAAADPGEAAKKNQPLIDKLLTVYFFWVNFQPLTRGSAAVGLCSLLGMLLSVGLELRGGVKEGVQTDWEGILCPDSGAFAAAISKWMVPRLAPVSVDLPSVAGLSTLEDALSTLYQP